MAALSVLAFSHSFLRVICRRLVRPQNEGRVMAKGQMKSNKEAKKPKKEKPKVLATANSNVTAPAKKK